LRAAVGRQKAKKTTLDFVSDAPLLSSAEWEALLRVLALSPQQSRVVKLLFDGKRDKQIAAAMNLSVWTVRSHLTKIFDRVEVSDRAELVLKIFRLIREHPDITHRRD
jgi:DNA-binding NarL/FixJ family response regulator